MTRKFHVRDAAGTAWESYGGAGTPPPSTDPVPSYGLAPTATYSDGDEFEGTSLDLTRWSYGEPDEVSGTGYFRNEAYAPVPPTTQNLEVSGSVLSLKARRTTDATSRGAKMSSAFITSRQKWNDFVHGVLEVRCTTPAGKSLWPAWWALSNGGYGETATTGIPDWFNGGGEWDWIEQYNSENISGVDTSNLIEVRADLSPAERRDYRRRGAQNEPGALYTVRPYVLDEQWHVWQIHRTSTFIRKYVDGVLIYQWVPGETSGTNFRDGVGEVACPPLPQWMFDRPIHHRFCVQVGDADAQYNVPSGTPGAEYSSRTGQWAIYEEGDFKIDYIRQWDLP